MRNFKKTFIGDAKFYRLLFIVVIPIIVQTGITNFVSLLDNIMVGQTGTNQMTGVAIANQLMMVFNLCIFGAISGAGIFGAQYYGKGDQEGVRYAFRFKLVICLLMVGIGFLVFLPFGKNLIHLYLTADASGTDAAETLHYGHGYLYIMLVGMIPFAIGQAYSSTLRECGETMLPMKAGIAAVLVNLLFNYLLIFGKFGFPKMGVYGAAIATVLSRFVECAIIVLWTHVHKKENEFIVGAYRHFRIPLHLSGQIILKGMPLLINEGLWSAGMAVLMQCYSVRGLDVVAGMNISSTISNLFNIVFMSMGNAVAIIIGQLLGSGDMEKAKDYDTKLIAFSVASSVLIGSIMAVIAPMFPRIYNTEPQVRELASSFIRVSALCMPIFAFLHTTYFTMRSGGKTVITFFFDSVYLWVVSAPLAYLLSRYTTLPIVALYLTCNLVDIIKCIIGYVLLRKGVWINNIVE